MSDGDLGLSEVATVIPETQEQDILMPNQEDSVMQNDEFSVMNTGEEVSIRLLKFIHDFSYALHLYDMQFTFCLLYHLVLLFFLENVAGFRYPENWYLHTLIIELTFHVSQLILFIPSYNWCSHL